MTSPQSLHTLILAAGASSRFGSPKQLALFQGRPLLQHAATRASEITGIAVTIVLGASARQIAPLVASHTCNVLINRAWQEGIASSIRAGIASLSGGCSGVLIMLGDQPLVGIDALNRLVNSWRRQSGKIVASAYEGIRGAPAIFPRWSFEQLLQLRGDQGARVLIRRLEDHVVGVDVPAAAIDIDVPTDLGALDTSVDVRLQRSHE